jgi:hypothetical protein
MSNHHMPISNKHHPVYNSVPLHLHVTAAPVRIYNICGAANGVQSVLLG